MAQTKAKQRSKRDTFIEAEELLTQRESNSSKRGRFTKAQLDKGGIVLNPKQTELYKGIRNNTLTICQGPAGTSKTFTACYTALSLLADGKINTIILTKPIQESGENLGFLPGTIAEKTDPFMKSYFSNFEKIVGKGTLEWMRATGEIIVEPLAYMRGTTYDNALMLMDESQNSTMTQLMLWVTRLGENSKAIMMGDISQYDIRKADSKFLEFIKIYENDDDIFNFSFKAEDIVRNKFLINIVEKYENWKLANDSKTERRK
jgi:phosphate starvation-inducible protein PhoH and related proteins